MLTVIFVHSQIISQDCFKRKGFECVKKDIFGLLVDR